MFVTAAFSFAGTELVGLAASETANPRESMPGAVKGTFVSELPLGSFPLRTHADSLLPFDSQWRITIIYISSLTIIGLLIPYTEPRLLGGSGAGESASRLRRVLLELDLTLRSLFFLFIPSLLPALSIRLTSPLSSCFSFRHRHARRWAERNGSPHQRYHLHLRSLHRTFLRLRWIQDSYCTRRDRSVIKFHPSIA